MRLVLGSLPRMVVMAAVVDTALFIPLAAILALLSFFLFGVSIPGFVTFGGHLGPVQGLIAWWMLFLVPALVYSAYMMPWHPRE